MLINSTLKDVKIILILIFFDLNVYIFFTLKDGKDLSYKYKFY